MEKIEFKEVVFDKDRYNNTSRNYREMAEKLPEHLEAFRKEDLPCTMEFIRMITATDTAFYDYIMKLLDEQIKGVWRPKEEKERISEIYHELYARLSADASALRRIIVIDCLPITEVDGVVVADMEKAEEMARKQATTEVDTKKMAEYYKHVSAVKKAIEELKEYAKKNGLPTMLENQLYINPMNGVQAVFPSNFFDGDVTPETFQTKVYKYFSKTSSTK